MEILTSTPSTSIGAEQEHRSRHVVFLIHGIRTQAEWVFRIADRLQQYDGSLDVCPIRYGFFDLVRFLVPGWRRTPFHRVKDLIWEKIEDSRVTGDNIRPKCSFIAHSFGTYIVTLILKETSLKIHRLILCGSIIRQSFKWEAYKDKIDPAGKIYALNDCGKRDPWPLIANRVTFGYGPTGRYGFGHPFVKDRFFDLGHSEFFSANFAEEYWFPFISRGHIETPHDGTMTGRKWRSIYNVVKVPNLILLAIVAAVSYSSIVDRLEYEHASTIVRVSPVDAVPRIDQFLRKANRGPSIDYRKLLDLRDSCRVIYENCIIAIYESGVIPYIDLLPSVSLGTTGSFSRKEGAIQRRTETSSSGEQTTTIITTGDKSSVVSEVVGNVNIEIGD